MVRLQHDGPRNTQGRSLRLSCQLFLIHADTRLIDVNRMISKGKLQKFQSALHALKKKIRTASIANQCAVKVFGVRSRHPYL